MSNQPKNPSRRKLVKKISVSGGVTLTAASLPGTWVQPLVESTILPTHAMTSVSFFGSDLMRHCKFGSRMIGMKA